ncbi:ferritin-like metal-binding protein YciE [Rhizobium wenxiniae]|uniref:Ferritin-like metal-binding protein YciE n=1 Tax=Rhizobium wenxiniae TaxID=1737357 RepID=A0A7W9YAW6_9HYPH|nr:ferritin-like metal-binding protein YciE [Rhizobium wenxiniae]
MKLLLKNQRLRFVRNRTNRLIFDSRRKSAGTKSSAFDFPGHHNPMEDNELAATKTLDDLFLDTLKDIYFAEKQILRALPKMARAAQSEEGKAGFLQHRDETQGQIERLEQVFELLGKAARGKTCEAIQGIIAEGEEIMEEFKGSPALDAGLISSAQAVEHYEIARYGTLIEWAGQLGLADAVPLLQANLQEEEATDQKLTQLAKASANDKAKAKKSA